MRVLHLFNEIKFSGAEVMYLNAAALMRDKGVEMLVCSTNSSIGDFAEQFVNANIEVCHKPINFTPLSVSGVIFYINFYKFLIVRKISVLHIHRSDLSFVAFIAKLAGVRCVKTQHATFRNPFLTRPYQIFLRFLLRTVCKVTYQSIGSTVYNNELVQYKNASVKVNNWYDSTRFYPKAGHNEPEELRRKLCLPEGSFIIISTGSCSTIKNHFEIIDALALLRTKGAFFYVHLGSGSCETAERNHAKNLGLEDDILFLGNRLNVREYLVASDVFVMTSRFEGLGNAALEAMACKIPALLYNVPGLRDLINNDDNGYLIEPNSSSLAEKLAELRDSPSDSIKNKVESGYSFVTNNFSMKANVSKIFSLYVGARVK